jgi:hypothetical protein
LDDRRGPGRLVGVACVGVVARVTRDVLIVGAIAGLPGLVLFGLLELDARRNGERERRRRARR